MTNLTTFGIVESDVLAQMNAIMNDEIPPAYACLMADNHLGYSVPVGGVVAYEKHINVNGVGFDIACGNKAVRLDVSADAIRKDIYRLMNDVQKHISFGVGRKNNERVEHDIFESPLWAEIGILRHLKDKAVAQLGTVGSGNHYVDIFTDESNNIWVGVHFGSRGLGHSICTHFIKAAGGKDGVHAKPVILSEDSDLGQQYIKCMELAGRYAYAGRDWVCSRVSRILRGNIVEEIHNHHNFAWKEHHHGRDLWVVRKGATPSAPGQTGFVGGSMGDISVIIQGKDSQASRNALFSTIHGAGRKLGRTSARGKYDRAGNCIKPGLVDRDKHHEWMKNAGVELRGGDYDESPFAYKRIEEVLDFHKDSIDILHTLKPIGVCMAGNNEFDPYKD